MHGLGYTVHANDLFNPLATFWRMVLDCPDELKARIRTKMPVTKEAFSEYRQNIMTLTDPLEIAATYFVVNRCSFSGSTFCGGYSREAAEKRMTESSVERISVSLDRMTIECKDAVEFLMSHPETHDTVVYADPPYAISNYVYGKDGDLHQAFDHVWFANTLKQRSDWVLSYNDCQLVRDLYKGCRILPVTWAYGMNRSKQSSEVVILPPKQSQE
jgi:DNA adenine methylase